MSGGSASDSAPCGVGEARCLPAAAYTTGRFLELERRTLFSDRWSRERIEVFVVGDGAMAPELAPVRRALVERFESFNLEDIAIVERLQDAFATTAFDGGRLSPAFDANIHHFHRLIGELTRREPASGTSGALLRPPTRPTA